MSRVDKRRSIVAAVAPRVKHDPSKLEVCFEYGVDVEHRRLYLHEEIDDVSSSNIVKGLALIDRTPGDIYIEITSPGGSVAHMFAIYDAIRECKQKVYTIGRGEIASAAGLILVAGDYRYATPNAWFMAHGISGGVDEGADILVTKSRIDAFLRQDKAYAKLMAKHTDLNENWWNKNAKESKKEIWFDVDQMKKHKIIDGVWPVE